MTDLTSLIGKSWAVPCDPPNSFDCWELVRYVRSLRGLDTPSIVNIEDRQPHHRRMIGEPPDGWRCLLIAKPFCVVRIGLAHVGVWLRHDQIIHAQHGMGVCISRPEHLISNDLTFWEYYDG